MKFTHGVTPEEIAGNDADIYMDDGIASTDLILAVRFSCRTGSLGIDPPVDRPTTAYFAEEVRYAHTGQCRDFPKSS